MTFSTSVCAVHGEYGIVHVNIYFNEAAERFFTERRQRSMAVTKLNAPQPIPRRDCLGNRTDAMKGEWSMQIIGRSIHFALEMHIFLNVEKYGYNTNGNICKLYKIYSYWRCVTSVYGCSAQLKLYFKYHLIFKTLTFKLYLLWCFNLYWMRDK